MYIVQFQIQNIWNKNEPDNIFKNVPNPSRKNSAALQLNDYNKQGADSDLRHINMSNRNPTQLFEKEI